LVGALKTITTKCFNKTRDVMGEKLWQRNYYERIIRDDDDYQRIAGYIQNNPLNWRTDVLWTTMETE